jgi:hypothetical protein
MLLEIADMFSLTIEGAHRLFGYDLDGIREYDLRLNGRRTHIVESYVFGRSGLKLSEWIREKLFNAGRLEAVMTFVPS